MEPKKVVKLCDQCDFVSVLLLIEEDDQLKVTGTCCVHVVDGVNEQIKKAMEGGGGKIVSSYTVKRPVNPELN